MKNNPKVKVEEKKRPDVFETRNRLSELSDALKILKTYKYMGDKKFLYEISRLGVVSTLTKSSSQKCQEAFEEHTGKNLVEFGNQLARIAEGYQNSNNLVKEIENFEEYIADLRYTGDLL